MEAGWWGRLVEGTYTKYTILYTETIKQQNEFTWETLDTLFSDGKQNMKKYDNSSHKTS